jgi:hypothetical protein
MLKLVSAALAIVLSAFAMDNAAQAGTYDLGTISSAQTITGGRYQKSQYWGETDLYTFIAGAPLTLTFTSSYIIEPSNSPYGVVQQYLTVFETPNYPSSAILFYEDNGGPLTLTAGLVYTLFYQPNKKLFALDDFIPGVTFSYALQFNTVSVATTPIPAALPLFLAGLGGLAVMARRRKKVAA